MLNVAKTKEMVEDCEEIYQDGHCVKRVAKETAEVASPRQTFVLVEIVEVAKPKNGRRLREPHACFPGKLYEKLQNQRTVEDCEQSLCGTTPRLQATNPKK